MAMLSYMGVTEAPLCKEILRLSAICHNLLETGEKIIYKNEYYVLFSIK